MKIRFSRLVILAACAAATMHAQAPAGPGPGQPRPPAPNMQAIAEALGVTCEYCHSAVRGSGGAEPKKDIARQMIAMTREINTRVDAATRPASATAVPAPATIAAGKVDCVTCHRGVPIPRQLGDIITQTAVQQGAAAAVAQYRDLRKQFYGRAAYDFGEATLNAVTQRIANSKPTEAIELAKLNVEFYPNSSPSWAALAYAYTRKVDDTNAIAALEKAVALDPSNNIAQGQLEQLKSYRRR